MYNLETLKEINQSYDYRHRITAGDVAMANLYKQAIELSRASWPKVGDILIRLNGTRAHIEDAEFAFLESKDKSIGICENPYIPFVSAKKL